MNVIELHSELKNRKIPKMLYSVEDGEHTRNRMSIRKTDNGKFVVFFDTTSGDRLYEMLFEDENSACEYMLSTFDKNYLR